ncbi:hypothetical protein [Kineosporia sp. NBRC 101731]|uniref:hypothetical protein n=1 Tax=Kineosporia sp. NBRC 101731 TaxID=3032199 RepID=UPI0024A3E14E|nr:hypothetical protein [Kineosporia sp. NBRC 101731]GLY32045.1 hypothetical protein Kisp02_54100 [Kineosporia sp. NBRC 101731]
MSYMRVDLNTPAMTHTFEGAPVYRKHAEVAIEEVPVGTVVETILADGTAETTLTATAERCIKVTNPGGEVYLIEKAKRDERYEHIEGDRWRARGRVHAFRNPHGKPVVIDAPWGEPQYGGTEVMFAVALDGGVLGSNRYLIGGAEFAETYRAEEDKTA